MYKSIFICIALTAGIILQSDSTASAASQPRSKIQLEDVLPDNTVFYLRTFDITAMDKVINNTAIGKLKTNPEIADFLNILTVKKEEFLDKLVSENSLDRPMVSKMINAQYSLALQGIDPSTGTPLIYISLTFPDSPNRKKLFDAIKGLARKNLSSYIPAQELKIQDTTVLNINLPGINSLLFKENNYFTLLSNVLVMTTSKAGLETIIKNYNHSQPNILARSKVFSLVKKKCNAKPYGSFVFLNTRIAIPLIKFMASPRVGKIIDALGLSGIDAFSFSIDFPNTSMRHTMYLYAPNQRIGIMRALKPSTDIEKISRKLPLNTSDVFSAKVDLIALKQDLPRLINALSSTKGFDLSTIIKLNPMMNKDSLFGIKTKDIINTLGDQVTFHSCPSGTVLRFENASAEKFENIIRAVEKKLNNSFTSITEGNNIIRYFNQSGKAIPFAPTYSIIDDNTILIATHPQVLKGFFRQKIKYHLNQSKDYQLATKNIPKQVSLLYYVHSTRSYTRVYDAFLPFFNVITAYNAISADPGILPPGNELEKYFFGFAISATSDKDGISVIANSPFGIGGPLIYGADKLITSNPAIMSMVAAWMSGYLNNKKNGDKR